MAKGFMRAKKKLSNKERNTDRKIYCLYTSARSVPTIYANPYNPDSPSPQYAAAPASADLAKDIAAPLPCHSSPAAACSYAVTRYRGSQAGHWHRPKCSRLRCTNRASQPTRVRCSHGAACVDSRYCTGLEQATSARRSVARAPGPAWRGVVDSRARDQRRGE